MPGAAHRMNKKECQVQAVALLAAGQGQASVAKELGVSQPTVSRFARRKDIKPLIEEAATILVQEGLGPAVEVVLDTLYESLEQGVVDDDHKRMKNLLFLRKLGLQVSENILRSVGVFPTHAPAPVIQKIVGGEGDQILLPVVREILIANSRLSFDPGGE